MKFINKIVDFPELFISWQEPYKEGVHRQRYKIAILYKNGDDANLEYLLDTTDFQDARQKGFEGFPRFSLNVRVHSNVLEYFSYRLPPKKRNDFTTFLNSIGLESSLKEEISYFQLLGYSGAKLPDDTLGFYINLSKVTLPFEFITELTGVVYQDSWSKNIEAISVDDSVDLKIDDANKYDRLAVEALWQGMRVGYINRVQSEFIYQWITSGRKISVIINRKNGTPERPRLYLHLNVS